jgi:hypothetical protein
MGVTPISSDLSITALRSGHNPFLSETPTSSEIILFFSLSIGFNIWLIVVNTNNKVKNSFFILLFF